MLFHSGRRCLLLKNICYSVAIPKVNKRCDDDDNNLMMLETAVFESLKLNDLHKIWNKALSDCGMLKTVIIQMPLNDTFHFNGDSFYFALLQYSSERQLSDAKIEGRDFVKSLPTN